MYDELVKALRGFDDYCRQINQNPSGIFGQAADAIEELSTVVRVQKAVLEKFPRWIPVTERLPEDLTRVIVSCEDGVSFGLCEHVIADDEEIAEWHDFLYYPITPTHWMPLPQPPEEGE